MVPKNGCFEQDRKSNPRPPWVRIERSILGAEIGNSTQSLPTARSDGTLSRAAGLIHPLPWQRTARFTLDPGIRIFMRSILTAQRNGNFRPAAKSFLHPRLAAMEEYILVPMTGNSMHWTSTGRSSG